MNQVEFMKQINLLNTGADKLKKDINKLSKAIEVINDNEQSKSSLLVNYGPNGRIEKNVINISMSLSEMIVTTMDHMYRKSKTS